MTTTVTKKRVFRISILIILAILFVSTMFLWYNVQINKMERYQIVLEQREDEVNLKVEIMVGKTWETDCNRLEFEGYFSTEKDKLGHWYYKFKEGKLIGTLKHCPDVRQMQFVYSSKTIPFDSRFPIVVSVPKSFEVKYRIWQNGKSSEEKNAEKQ